MFKEIEVILPLKHRVKFLQYKGRGKAYYYVINGTATDIHMTHLLSMDRYDYVPSKMKEVSWEDIPRSYQLDALALNPTIRNMACNFRGPTTLHPIEIHNLKFDSYQVRVDSADTGASDIGSVRIYNNRTNRVVSNTNCRPNNPTYVNGRVRRQARRQADEDSLLFREIEAEIRRENSLPSNSGSAIPTPIATASDEAQALANNESPRSQSDDVVDAIASLDVFTGNVTASGDDGFTGNVTASGDLSGSDYFMSDDNGNVIHTSRWDESGNVVEEESTETEDTEESSDTTEESETHGAEYGMGFDRGYLRSMYNQISQQPGYGYVYRELVDEIFKDEEQESNEEED